MSSTSSIDGKVSWLAWITCIAFAAPIALNFGSMGHKPIDLTIGDLWLFFLAAVFLFISPLKASHTISFSKEILLIALIPLFYYSLLGMLSGIATGDPTGNMVSMIRFVKQFLFILVGWKIFQLYGYSIVKPFTFMLVAILLVTFLSDIAFGDFPFGCGFESRWGGCIGKVEVYGFPNSSASYYVAALGLLLGTIPTRLMIRNVLLVVIPAGVVLVVFSLSRAAWIYIAWLFVVSWFVFFSVKQKILTTLIVLLFLVFGYFPGENPTDESMATGVFLKIERSLGDDPSSGRFDIWIRALELAADRPVMGYGFDHFSKYVEGYDTPHNQYLEIIFKSGLVGLFIHLSLILMLWVVLKSKRIQAPKKTLAFLRWGVVFGLLMNGLFQPILSYSIVANLLMLSIGFALAAARLNTGSGKDETTFTKFG